MCSGLRKARERRRSGLVLAEGPREVARARAAGLTFVATYFAPDADRLGRRRRGRRAGAAQDELPRRAGRRARRRRDPTPRAPATTARCCSSRSGSRSPATSARWRAPLTPPVPTRCSSPTPSATRGTRTRSARRPDPSSRCRSSRSTRRRRRARSHTEGRRRARRARGRTPSRLHAPTAFLVGAEDDGLDDAWQSIADDRVVIPMKDGAAADSLNASAAAAVLLYEAVRQRRALLEPLLLGDAAGQHAPGHEHVVVGTVDERERRAVALRRSSRRARPSAGGRAPSDRSTSACFGSPVALAKNAACVWMYAIRSATAFFCRPCRASRSRPCMRRSR